MKYLKHLALLSALTPAAFGQADLDSIRSQRWMMRDSSAHDLWSIDDSDTTGLCQLEFRDLDPSTWSPGALLASAQMPFHRLGAVFGVHPLDAAPGSQKWAMLASGLLYAFDGSVFPSGRTGVMCWLEIERIAGAYSTNVVAFQTYGDLDLVRGDFDDGGSVAIDASARAVVYNAWTPDPAILTLPAPGSWVSVADNGDVGGLLDAPAYACLGHLPLSPGEVVPKSSDKFALWSVENPNEFYSLEHVNGVWGTTYVLYTPSETKGLIVRGAFSLGGQDGIEVFAGADMGSTVTITLKDDLGATLLAGHTVGTGAWQALPPLPALNDRPGRRHDVLVLGSGGAQNWVYPTVRHGGPFNGKAGFEIGRGYVSPWAEPGDSIRSGVHVSTTLPNTSTFSLVCVVGLRDAQGNDPVIDLGGQMILDINNTQQVASVTLASDAPIERLGSSCGMNFDVPNGTGEQVVLFQYAFFFPDGAIAFSDVFGTTVK